MYCSWVYNSFDRQILRLSDLTTWLYNHLSSGTGIRFQNEAKRHYVTNKCGVLVTSNENEPLEPRLTSLKGTLVVFPGERDSVVVLGLARMDTISGTRLMGHVPIFPTRSSPTKSTPGWQQLDVYVATIDLFTTPWLNLPTKKIKTNISRLETLHEVLKCYIISRGVLHKNIALYMRLHLRKSSFFGENWIWNRTGQ